MSSFGKKLASTVYFWQVWWPCNPPPPPPPDIAYVNLCQTLQSYECGERNGLKALFFFKKHYNTSKEVNKWGIESAEGDVS